MLKIIRGLILLGACFWFFSLLSCSLSLKGKSSSSSSDGTSTSSASGGASTTIASIPDLKLKNVPDSLSSGSDLKLKSMPASWVRKTFRNVGDVTNFDPAGLPDVKAQGWIDMRENIKNTPIMVFLAYLKNYASNNTVAYDTDIRLGHTNVEGQDIDMGVVRCHQASDDELDIYWSIKESFMTQSFILPCFLKVVKDSNGKVKVGFLATVSINAFGISAKETFYSMYDEVSNETLNFSLDQSGNVMVNHIYPDSGGGMVILTYYNASGIGYASTNLSIAWGDNSQGGLISANDVFSGSNSNNSINTEYYNQDGSLVFRSWGQNALPDTSWLSYYVTSGSGTNLKDCGFSAAPDSFAVIYDYSSYPYIETISNVSSGATVSVSNVYEFYYKASVSAWSPGDIIYWPDAGIWDGSKYIQIYNKGYMIPASQSYFGRPYFMQNEWPMKYLTLQPAYSTYTLTRKEGNTYGDTSTNVWENLDGETETNISSWSWTDYNWWLAKNPDTNADPTNDITLRNIQADTVYIWNGTNMDKEKGLFVYGSEATPNYFIMTAAASNIVSSVNTKISNIYEANKNFDLAALTNSFPAMPASNQFPDVP